MQWENEKRSIGVELSDFYLGLRDENRRTGRELVKSIALNECQIEDCHLKANEVKLNSIKHPFIFFRPFAMDRLSQCEFRRYWAILT